MNLLSALLLVAVLVLLAFGLPALNGSLPDQRPVSSEVPYDIGGGVTIIPPIGATIDLSNTRPQQDQGTVLFRVGPVRYAITVERFTGTLESAAEQLRRRITGNPGYQVTGLQHAINTRGGITGVQGGYTAPGRGGRYAVFVVDGHTIEVTVSGAELDLGRWLPAIEISTRTIAYAGERR